MKKIILLLFTAFISYYACSNINLQNVYVHQTPEKSNVNKALDIIIDEFEKRKVFSKQEMLNIINAKGIKNHDKCKSSEHKLRIIFVPGEWSKEKKRFCIYSNDEHLKGQCLSGLFNGLHTIQMITDKSNNNIYSTSFAHEVLHYFQKYIRPPSLFHLMDTLQKEETLPHLANN